MPLKHLTETVFVVLLAGVMILTGVLLSTLPDLPAGALPWGIVAALTIAYPLALYPVLKRNRAEYEFRILHFAPALFAALWLLAQMLEQRWGSVNVFERMLMWGYGGLPVSIFLLLLIAFCLQVIRRRVPRITLLLLLFVPYAAAAVLTEQSLHWDRQLASALWSWTDAGTGTGGQIAQNTNRSLPRSQDPDEEEWRQKLRDQDASDRAKSAGIASSSLKAVSSSSHAPIVSKPKPGTLPGAGPEGFLMLSPFLAAAYCGVLHQRAKKRV